jgi:hypothetical protein
MLTQDNKLTSILFSGEMSLMHATLPARDCSNGSCSMFICVRMSAALLSGCKEAGTQGEHNT